MSIGVVELRGGDVFCSVEGGAEARLAAEAAEARLAGWAARYDAASRGGREEALTAIGREMFAWLDEADWASGWTDGLGDRLLEVRVPSRADPRAAVLLDAPWELLTDAGGVPLSLDALQLFVVARRIGAPQPPAAPGRGDLQMLFMAAAPEGQVVLDFEAEEAAILEATSNESRVHVAVEESGALAGIRVRLSADEGPFEALHLSSHGDIVKGRGPVLLLETLEGGEELAGPGELAGAFGPAPPALVVLSACRTAERGQAGGAPAGAGQRGFAEEGAAWRDAGAGAKAAVGPELVTPFARQLASLVANVVGWDGSVFDRDASDFAAAFYAELGLRSGVPRAAAVGRRALLRARAEDPRRGRHWHLARVYLGPGGGGPLCAANLPLHRAGGGREDRTWLDEKRKRVPVATRAAFVGRRRAIQRVLRAFRPDTPTPGVLVHGMGALGKSSLAARVAARAAPGLRTVLIFARYDALAVFDELLAAVPAREKKAIEEIWRAEVKRDATVLEEALADLLAGPFAAQPILLIVDDLERILEAPAPGEDLTRVQADYRPVLAAVLAAFDQAAGKSRLLITSRYDFRLPDGRGGDAAAGLVREHLQPMPERDRMKQLRAAERLAGRDEAADPAAAALLAEALSAAGGNPGLQAVLTTPILAGEHAAAREALRQIAVYRETGAPPAEIQALLDAGTAKDSANALIAFFARLSFASYRAALTADEARQLAAATLFAEGVPIPRTALAAAGAAHGVEAPEPALDRLLGLGLLDPWDSGDGPPHAAANPLARPLAGDLADADWPRLARAAVPALAAAWRDPQAGFPDDPRGLQAARLALEAGVGPAVPAELLEAAVLAGADWLARGAAEPRNREALALIEAARTALPEDHAADPDFLRLGVECASALGEAEVLDALLAAPSRDADDTPEVALSQARLDLRRADRLITLGRPEEAEALARSVQATAAAAGDDRLAAFASGRIADMLQTRGEFDEALRIRHEAELPVYERLGDVHERANVTGKVANVLEARGELDEALRIRREEQLPVYERLGDVRSRAVTMGRIADVLQARGEFDEALRIRREEVLPVYERLGDVRSRAVTMGRIADVLQARGELDEALRIRREEQLPVYERLGDVRARAVTIGRIADVLQARGELDEALRILREEMLPMFERLGDVRSRAVTMGYIADVLVTRGELDEALRILREEMLPVFERLGDVRSRAVTMGYIADVLVTRGELDEALRIRREEQLPVYERLGDVRGHAVTTRKIAEIDFARGRLDEALDGYKKACEIIAPLGAVGDVAVFRELIADVLQARGEFDEALRIRREEVLPVHERLGDIRGRSVTLQKIGSALLEAGGLEQGHIQEIYEALAEAFAIARQLGLPDGIGNVGLQLAEVMAIGGLRDEALEVLDAVDAAFERLGNAERRQAAAQLHAAIGGDGGP